jgi:outer membrane protein
MRLKFVLLISFFLTSFCYASQKIAVIDINEIFQKSSAGISINNEIKQKQEALKKDIIKKQEALQERKKNLIQQKNTLSKDGYQKKEENIQADFISLQKEIKEKTDSLEKEYFQKLEKINTNLNQVTEKYSKEKNIDLIIQNTQVVYKSEMTPDITQDILSELNKITK